MPLSLAAAASTARGCSLLVEGTVRVLQKKVSAGEQGSDDEQCSVRGAQ